MLVRNFFFLIELNEAFAHSFLVLIKLGAFLFGYGII